MKRIVSTILILLMLVTMIPTAFAAETIGYSGVSALTALFISADLEDVFDAYDTAFEFIGDSSDFYTGAPADFKDAISAELPDATFNALYDATVAVMDESQASKSEVYEDLAGVVSGNAPALISKINGMDLRLDDGSKVGTVVYYMGKLAQEKKIAKYDTYTGELEFDLGRITGSADVVVNDDQGMYFDLVSGTYTVEAVAKSIFTKFLLYDYDDVSDELNTYLNEELTAYLAADDGNLGKMVNALDAFGFLHEYSTKPSSGGGGGGFVIPILPPEPAPEDPGLIDGEAIEVEAGETKVEVTVDGDAVETAVEEAVTAGDGTTVVVPVPDAAIPRTPGDQVEIVIPESGVAALSEGGVDLVLQFGDAVMTIQAEEFVGLEGELRLQISRIAAPVEREAEIANEALRKVSTTRGLMPGFNMVEVLVAHAGQTLLNDHSGYPIHAVLPLDESLKPYYDTLGLYRYNVTSGYYDFVSGTIEHDLLIADLDHLSEFAVLNVVADFTDMTDHWANSAVASMAAKHVINGIGGGKYDPEAPVTRAEFTKMLVGVKSLSLDGAPSFYEDVRNGDWFKPYVDAAYANGLVYGGTDQSFLPNQNATRLEMMMMLSYSLDVTITEDVVDRILMPYDDADQIPVLHRADVAKVIRAGLIKGYNGNLYLNDGLTRAEAATVMYRMFNR